MTTFNNSNNFLELSFHAYNGPDPNPNPNPNPNNPNNLLDTIILLGYSRLYFVANRNTGLGKGACCTAEWPYCMLIRYTVVYVKFFTLFCCSMDDSYRPVKLRKVVIGYSCNENTTNFKFDLSLNYKLSGIIHTYSENKPTLVVSTKTVKAQASQRTLRHCIHLYI